MRLRVGGGGRRATRSAPSPTRPSAALRAAGGARGSHSADRVPLRPGATRRRASLFMGPLLLVGLLGAGAAWGADYGGPPIDAHSHVPNATAIDGYVAA